MPLGDFGLAQPKPLAPIAARPGGLPGIYPAHQEQSMVAETTPSGVPKYAHTPGIGWHLNPENPDNAPEKRGYAPQPAEPVANPGTVNPIGSFAAGLGRIGLGGPATPPAPVAVTQQSAGGYPQGPAPVAARPSFAKPADMRKALVAGLDARMQAAHASGDSNALSDLFAERSALDTGGFEGHSRFRQEQAASKQAAELNAAQIAKLGGTANGGRFPMNQDGTLNQDALRQTGFKETNSVAGGEAHAQEGRIAFAENQERAGKPFSVDPSDAPAIIDSRAAHIAQFLQPGPKGGASGGSLPELFANIRAVDPKVLDNPNSLIAQAIGHRIRQLYGTELGTQLSVPFDPGKTHIGIAKTAGPGWESPASDWVMSNLINMSDGYAPRLRPGAFYDQQKNAADLYQRLTNPQLRP